MSHSLSLSTYFSLCLGHISLYTHRKRHTHMHTHIARGVHARAIHNTYIQRLHTQTQIHTHKSRPTKRDNPPSLPYHTYWYFLLHGSWIDWQYFPVTFPLQMHRSQGHSPCPLHTRPSPLIQSRLSTGQWQLSPVYPSSHRHLPQLHEPLPAKYTGVYYV